MKKPNVILNGNKGIYTIEEVCGILRDNDINFKIVMPKGRSNSVSQKFASNHRPNKIKIKGGEI